MAVAAKDGSRDGEMGELPGEVSAVPTDAVAGDRERSRHGRRLWGVAWCLPLALFCEARHPLPPAALRMGEKSS